MTAAAGTAAAVVKRRGAVHGGGLMLLLLLLFLPATVEIYFHKLPVVLYSASWPLRLGTAEDT